MAPDCRLGVVYIWGVGEGDREVGHYVCDRFLETEQPLRCGCSAFSRVRLLRAYHRRAHIPYDEADTYITYSLSLVVVVAGRIHHPFIEPDGAQPRQACSGGIIMAG